MPTSYLGADFSKIARLGMQLRNMQLAEQQAESQNLLRQAETKKYLYDIEQKEDLKNYLQSKAKSEGILTKEPVVQSMPKEKTVTASSTTSPVTKKESYLSPISRPKYESLLPAEKKKNKQKRAEYLKLLSLGMEATKAKKISKYLTQEELDKLEKNRYDQFKDMLSETTEQRSAGDNLAKVILNPQVPEEYKKQIWGEVHPELSQETIETFNASPEYDPTVVKAIAKSRLALSGQLNKQLESQAKLKEQEFKAKKEKYDSLTSKLEYLSKQKTAEVEEKENIAKQRKAEMDLYNSVLKNTGNAFFNVTTADEGMKPIKYANWYNNLTDTEKEILNPPEKYDERYVDSMYSKSGIAFDEFKKRWGSGIKVYHPDTGKLMYELGGSKSTETSMQKALSAAKGEAIKLNLKVASESVKTGTQAELAEGKNNELLATARRLYATKGLGGGILKNLAIPMQRHLGISLKDNISDLELAEKLKLSTTIDIMKQAFTGTETEKEFGWAAESNYIRETSPNSTLYNLEQRQRDAYMLTIYGSYGQNFINTVASLNEGDTAPKYGSPSQQVLFRVKTDSGKVIPVTPMRIYNDHRELSLRAYKARAQGNPPKNPPSPQELEALYRQKVDKQ